MQQDVVRETDKDSDQELKFVCFQRGLKTEASRKKSEMGMKLDIFHLS